MWASTDLQINSRFEAAIKSGTYMLDSLPVGVLSAMEARAAIIDATLQLTAANV
jgi:hypothetical protein